MSDLGLIYCPAADPDLDTKVKDTTYVITQKTAEQIKAGFEADGYPCTMKEVRQIKKWMMTDPHETEDGQIGEYTNRCLQHKEKENITKGFKCLRAYLKGKISVKHINLLENEFSFMDGKKKITFVMPTLLGKHFKKNNIVWDK